MVVNVIVYDAEEGGFWAEVPTIPGCATQGDTMDEVIRNVQEAVRGCLAVDVEIPTTADPESHARVIAVTV